jgi:hypothetical protein
MEKPAEAGTLIERILERGMALGKLAKVDFGKHAGRCLEGSYAAVPVLPTTAAESGKIGSGPATESFKREMS